jgi:hypothetical protein
MVPVATRECRNCGETFDNTGATVGQPLVPNCGHVGTLYAIAVQQQGEINVFTTTYEINVFTTIESLILTSI